MAPLSRAQSHQGAAQPSPPMIAWFASGMTAVPSHDESTTTLKALPRPAEAGNHCGTREYDAMATPPTPKRRSRKMARSSAGTLRAVAAATVPRHRPATAAQRALALPTRSTSWPRNGSGSAASRVAAE